MSERLTFDAFLNLTEIITEELDSDQIVNRRSLIKLFAKHTQFEAPTKNEVAESGDAVLINYTKNTTTGKVKFKNKVGNNSKGSPGNHEYIEKGPLNDVTQLLNRIYTLASKSTHTSRFLAAKVNMNESTLMSGLMRLKMHLEDSKKTPKVRVMQSVVPKLTKLEQFLIKEKEKEKGKIK